MGGMIDDLEKTSAVPFKVNWKTQRLAISRQLSYDSARHADHHAQGHTFIDRVVPDTISRSGLKSWNAKRSFEVDSPYSRAETPKTKLENSASSV